MGAWAALALLGAGHGINPGMGWLFAVALGLQEGSARAVWRALPALAVGHALAIAAAVAATLIVGQVIPAPFLEWMVAALLIGIGVDRLRRHRHPRGGGMRVGFRGLVTWSFLMASAHGAGLMVVPLLLARGLGGEGQAAHAGHWASIGSGGGAETGLLVTLVHSAGYLLVTGVIALVVYRWLGLRLLRSMWINLDAIWGAVLVATGLLTIAL